MYVIATIHISYPTMSVNTIFNDIIEKCSRTNYLSIVIKAPFIYSDELVTKLIGAGADVKVNIDGVTPYMWACAQGKLNFVKILLDNGVSLDDTNKARKNPLIVASRNGHTDIVEFLLDRGIPIEIKSRSNPYRGTNALIMAASNNEVETVKFLLERGANIEASFCGKTSLLAAASFGNTECLDLLIKKGANMEARFKNKSALLLAAENGRHGCISRLLEKGDKYSFNTSFLITAANGKYKCVQTLLDHENSSDNPYEKEKALVKLFNRVLILDMFKTAKVIIESGGADINTTNNKGLPLIMMAVKMGNIEAVKYLIERGCEIDKKDTNSKNALSLAIKLGLLAISTLLLESGSDVNMSTGVLGDTPLILALKAKQFEISLLLIEKGANVNTFNKQGYNPLMICMSASRYRLAVDKVISKLTENGANVNVKNECGNTPLMKLILDGDIKTIKRVIENGGDVTIKNKLGQTGLHLAHNRSVEILECVMNGIKNVNTEDRNGETVLYKAFTVGKWDNIKFLLENGADPNTKPINRRSPLMIACENRIDTTIVSLLIEKGANVGYKDDKMNTSLMVACKVGNTEKVKILLENSANPNSMNRYMKTPLILAVEHGHLEIAQILVDSGAELKKSYLIDGISVDVDSDSGSEADLSDCCDY